jgi:hypothetical protein
MKKINKYQEQYRTYMKTKTIILTGKKKKKKNLPVALARQHHPED